MTLRGKQKLVECLCSKEYSDRGETCRGCEFNHNEAWCNLGTEIDLSESECDEIIQTFLKDVIEPTEPTEESKPTEQTEDLVNHPNHYTNGGIECIDEMILIFGIEWTMHFCLLNAWKYRKRCLYKGGEEDIQKSDWYLQKYKELKEGLRSTNV